MQKLPVLADLLNHHVIICSPLYGHDNGPLARSSTSPQYVLVDPATPHGLSSVTLKDVLESPTYQNHQIMVLEHFQINPSHPVYLRSHPVIDGKICYGMASGNYLMSSDSRYRTLISPYPVPVHDRIEY